MPEGRIRVGPCIADFGTSRIRSARSATRLEPKVMEVLGCLLEAEGELVSKDELLDRVWFDVHVTDAVVFRAIRLLRDALGEDPELGPPIETLRGRGYRVTWPIARLAGTERATTPEPAVRRPVARQPRARLPLAAAAGITFLTAVALFILAGGGEPTGSVDALPGAEAALSAGLASYARLDRPGVESAILHFDRALGTDPALARAHAGLSAALTQKYRLFDPDAELLARARRAAATAVDLEPELAEGHRAVGLAAVEAGRLREARTAFERAVALDPDSSARGNLGSVWISLGRPDLALAAYDRLPPGPVPPTWVREVNRAAALAALERYAEARAALERARRDEPLHPGVVGSAASLDMLQGRRSAARERLRSGLTVQPASPLLHTLRGELALLDGRYDRAATSFRQALEVGTADDAGARLGLAHARLRMGESEAARESLERLIEQARTRLAASDESMEPWIQLARAEALRDRPDHAFEALRRAADAGLPSPRAIEIAPEFRTVQEQPGFDRWIDGLRERVRRLDRSVAAVH